MALEAGDEGLVGDLPNELVVIDDGAAAIDLQTDDLITLDPVLFVDPLPVFEDFATVDDAVFVDLVLKDDSSVDGAAGDDTAAPTEGDYTDLFTTDVVAVDGEVTDGSDPVIYTMTGELGAGELGTSEEGEIAFGGGEFDVPAGGTDEVIGRPVDPMPNWRTVTGGESSEDGTGVVDADGTAETGGKGDIAVDDIAVDDIALDDIAVIACEDYPMWSETGDSSNGDTGSETKDGAEFTYEDFIAIYGKDPIPADEDGTPPMVYTMGATDPLIYASSATGAETPGRNTDPLPFERTLDTPAAASGPVPQSEPEIDRTPVNYAAADSFHTGLDLL